MAGNFLPVLFTLVLATPIVISTEFPPDGFRFSVVVLFDNNFRSFFGETNAKNNVRMLIDQANTFMNRPNLKIQVDLDVAQWIQSRIPSESYQFNEFVKNDIPNSNLIRESNLYIILTSSGSNEILTYGKLKVCDGDRKNRVVLIRWRNLQRASKRLIHQIGLALGIDTDYVNSPSSPRISKTGVNCLLGSNYMEDNTDGNSWSQCSVESMQTLYKNNKLSCIGADYVEDFSGIMRFFPAPIANRSPVLEVQVSRSKKFTIYLSEVEGHKVTEHKKTCAGRLCAYQAVTNIRNEGSMSYAMMSCDLQPILTSLQSQLLGTNIYLFDDDVTIFNVTTLN